MKLGILIANGCVARWQADALSPIAGGNRFIVYDCINSRASARRFRHGAYYALNLLAVRNRMTRPVPLPRELDVEDVVRFTAERDGAWERLPADLVTRIGGDRPAAIIKFGMGLLRIPDELGCPILSYHHGDPRAYRGRPAGFHELVNGERVMGQVVQILSNRLDAGRVVAFVETKVHRHSWKKSLVDAFKVSPLLLPVALRNAAAGRDLGLECDGPNYRLPSNLAVARLLARLAAAKTKRLAYGALVEKRWQSAEIELADQWSLADLADETRWTQLGAPDGTRFIADPFFDPESDAVLAEAMPADGRGRIVRLGSGGWDRLPIGRGHCSYPAGFVFEGTGFLLPEVASWSPPLVFEIANDGLRARRELGVPGRPRLLDATLHEHEGHWYLFASRKDEGGGVLRLWVAQSPFGAFAEHPLSPIRISPAGARMAGNLLELRGALLRPCQDLRGDYGDGLLLFRIDRLSPNEYAETEIESVKFADRWGPHTLNVRGNRALIDFYDQRFAPLAWLRRLRQSRTG